MDHLWSPWRLAYVTATGAPADEAGCIFCKALEGSDDLIVARAGRCYVILNLYPYNNGHLMVVPNRHVGTLEASTGDERSELMRLTRHAEMALAEAYKPQGINVGMNLGRPAGAGIVDHLHVHVVPRWIGDTNFMPVLGDVRVHPEPLEAAYDRLKGHLVG